MRLLRRNETEWSSPCDADKDEPILATLVGGGSVLIAKTGKVYFRGNHTGRCVMMSGTKQLLQG